MILLKKLPKFKLPPRKQDADRTYMGYSEDILALRKMCPYSNLFWSIFSLIRTVPEYTDQNNSKYGHILRSMDFI